jgi:hypothetical protein
LITEAVESIRDGHKWADKVAEEERHRTDLAEASSRWDEVADYLKG